MNEQLVRFENLKDSRSISVINISIPNLCPFCHKNMNPSLVNKTKYDNILKKNVAILFQCSYCYKYFSAEYKVNSYTNTLQAHTSEKLPNIPSVKIEYNLPEEIDVFSTQFREIYTQSLSAEEHGLTAISGVGFRKSIEFLVKDFLIKFVNHEDSEKIKTMPLSQSIKKIDNDKIISLAIASTWLGNDETHYQRKFENKDVKDMKKFIKALTFYVSSEVVAFEADEMINSN